MGRRPVAIQFPLLYNITLTKKITVAVLNQKGWEAINFRLSLYGNKLRDWNNMKKKVGQYELARK